MAMSRVLRIFLLLLPVLGAFGQNKPGFGTLKPEWQSIYNEHSSRTQPSPYLLIDSNGRKSASAVIYVVAHGHDRLYGDRQVELGSKLYIKVQNLTTDCTVVVEWINFAFRTDAKPIPLTLSGALDVKLSPGQTLQRFFTLPTVTTYIDHRSVPTEVRPALVLNCPNGNAPKKDAPLSMNNSTAKESLRTAHQNALLNLGRFDIHTPPTRGGYRYNYLDVRTEACLLTYTLQNPDTGDTYPNKFALGTKGAYFNETPYRIQLLDAETGASADFPVADLDAGKELESVVEEAMLGCRGSVIRK